MINLRADTAVADIGVDIVGKIDDRGATGELLDLAVGCEYINLVGEQVYLEVLEKFMRVARFLLGFEQILQPEQRALLYRIRGGGAGLAQPVRGYSGPGH